MAVKGVKASKKESKGSTPGIEAFREGLRTGRRGTHHLHVTLLGLDLFDTKDLLRQVEEGFSFREMEQFQKNVGISMREIAELIQIKPRTFIRRREGGSLQPDESDRLLRASRLFGKAIELFEGDVEAARHWLSTPQTALGRVAPLTLARTEVGAREVENLISRLEHGVFS